MALLAISYQARFASVFVIDKAQKIADITAIHGTLNREGYKLCSELKELGYWVRQYGSNPCELMKARYI